MSAPIFARTLLRPASALAELRGAPPKRGALPVVVAGIAWAALSLWLALSGEVPTRPAPLIAPELHYMAQAIFVVPLFVASWGILSATAARIARAPTRDVAAPLGYAYGVPLLVTWALPDAFAFGIAGFDALSTLVRIVAPLTAIYTLVLAALAIRAVTNATPVRALSAALAGLVAQALVGSWALR